MTPPTKTPPPRLTRLPRAVPTEDPPPRPHVDTDTFKVCDRLIIRLRSFPQRNVHQVQPNMNQGAQSPLDYDTAFSPTSYYPSLDSQHNPHYTILLDKFSDWDLTNNIYFGAQS